MSDVFKVGNLTRDPELRFTNGGKPVAEFGIAENRKRGDEETVSFFNVKAWGSLGENVAASLGKGQRVIVVGDLVQREYETKEGEKRSVVEIVAWHVGPDLTWATAEVTKADSGSSGRSSGRGGRSSGRRAPQQDPIYGDEEPF